MILSPEDRNYFFEIFLGLLAFVNDKHHLVKKFGHPKLAKYVKKEDAMTLTNKLRENPDIIDDYIASARNMTQEKVEILRSWKTNRIDGQFLYMRQLKKYAVFLDTAHNKLYGVLGISNPLSDFFPSLPKMIHTVLLPFQGHIIYDSLINRCSVTFGSNMRQDFHEQYMEIKRRAGIITSIDGSPDCLTENNPPSRVSADHAAHVSHNGKDMHKEQVKEKQRILQDMVGAFCRRKLDEEYGQLCMALVAKMGRKRTVPFASGKIEIWAAAVVHAVGTVNFLFDKSFKPFISFDEINAYFGTSKSSVGQKSKLIRDMFKMDYFNNEFLTQNLQAENPLSNLVEVNGFLVSISSLPKDIQETVRKLRSEGKKVSVTTEAADEDDYEESDDMEEDDKKDGPKNKGSDAGETDKDARQGELF